MPTQQEIQAAAAAAAQNQQTAEQAAMLNAAYRANELPVTPAYSNLGQPTQEEYAEAQREAVKHQIAFSQPRSDVRQLSGEALAISQQYAASRNRVVTGGGVSYQGPVAQQNPYAEDTALGIAWDVGRTGGATDVRLNVIAEQEAAVQGVDPSFIRYATDVYRERPQFEREVLVTKEGQQFVNPEWHGVPIRLNLTRAEMAAGGGITPDTYQKYLRYDEKTYLLNRLTSPEARFGIDTGVHKERGDFGGPWLKEGSYGGWRSGGGARTVGDRLVGSKMVASQATYGVEGQDVSKLPKPFVSVPSRTTIESPQGKVFGMYIPGISEGIAFFEPKSKVTTIEKRTPMEPVTTFGEPYTEEGVTVYPSTTKSGDIIETTKTTTPIPGTSGLDEFNAMIRKTLMLPAPEVGEKALEIGSAATPFSTGFAPVRIGKEAVFGAADVLGIKTAEARKTSAEAAAATDIYKGQYESFYEQPALVAGSFVAGAAFGTVFKGVSAVGGAARARLAPAIVSRGQTARAVEMYGAGAWKATQVAMAGAYAVDLSGRATKGFTEFSPATVAPRARAMAVQEVYPMTVGFGMPERVIKSARIAEIGYKQAILEGEAATGKLGRADWYIRQPITRVASRPVDLIKQDYRAFIQEQTAKTPSVQIRKPGLTEYLTYKVDKPITPEMPTIKAPQKYAPTELGLQPVSTEYGAEIIRPAYGKHMDIGLLAKKKLGFGVTPQPEVPLLRTSESTVFYQGKWSKVIREPVGEVSPELSLKAYGKRKPVFEQTSVMQEPHPYARLVSEKKAMSFISEYKTQPVSIRVKAYLQEHPSAFMENLRISSVYPEREISNINVASRVRLGTMFGETARPKWKSTLNIWAVQPREFERGKTPYPESKPVETKTKGGQVLVSRVETVQKGFPVLQEAEGFRVGMPVYPSGPSPIQKQRSYIIEEETQYYRLPPGMKSPGQKQETIQSIVSLPALESRISLESAQKSTLITRQVQEQRFMQDLTQRSMQEQKIQPDFMKVSLQDRITKSDIFTGQRHGISTAMEPRFDISQITEQGQRQEQITGQDTRQIETGGGKWVRGWETTTPHPPPPPFPGGFLPGGGGGAGPAGSLGVRSWQRENLIADQPYLARGISERDFGFAEEMGGFDFEGAFGGRKSRKSKRRKHPFNF